VPSCPEADLAVTEPLRQDFVAKDWERGQSRVGLFIR
jgi:hypothetical protein